MTSVLIAGFHRSGTSMLARMFHEGGLFLGENLLGAHGSNPYGHFEDKQIIDFHDRILKENGTSWQFDGNYAELVMSKSSRDQLNVLVSQRNLRCYNWGLKDPRICLFLKEWYDASPECYIVAIFRDFISTTQSLLKRHSSDLLLGRGPAPVHLRFWQDHELPYRMWLAYNRSLLDALKVFPERSYVTYHSRVLAGLDVPAQVDAKTQIGLKPVDTTGLIDLNVTQTSAQNLPAIGAELLASLVQTWNEIESVWGPSGVAIEDMIGDAFKVDGFHQASGRTTGELDEAHAQYSAAFSRYAASGPRGHNSNCLPNGEFADGTVMPWTYSSGDGARVSPKLNYSPELTLRDRGTGYVFLSAKQPTVKIDYTGAGDIPHGIPVRAGQRYCFFGHFGTHRCKCRLSVLFHDGGGRVIEKRDVSIPENVSGGNAIEKYCRADVDATAPKGAVAATLQMTAGIAPDFKDAFFFFTRLWFGEWTTGAEPPRWNSSLADSFGTEVSRQAGV